MRRIIILGIILLSATLHAQVEQADDGAAGNTTEPSAEEIAANLANPNTPLASLTFRLQYRTFDGDLPEASSQNLSLIHISEPTRPPLLSRMPSSA